VFVGYDAVKTRPSATFAEKNELGKAGALSLKLDTLRAAGVPYIYTLEGMWRTCPVSTSPIAEA
jgi:hypothetical protein